MDQTYLLLFLQSHFFNESNNICNNLHVWKRFWDIIWKSSFLTKVHKSFRSSFERVIIFIILIPLRHYQNHQLRFHHINSVCKLHSTLTNIVSKFNLNKNEKSNSHSAFNHYISKRASFLYNILRSYIDKCFEFLFIMILSFRRSVW